MDLACLYGDVNVHGYDDDDRYALAECWFCLGLIPLDFRSESIDTYFGVTSRFGAVST